eukprot:366012-Chlamydomonas_euryale.AAC.22
MLAAACRQVHAWAAASPAMTCHSLDATQICRPLRIPVDTGAPAKHQDARLREGREWDGVAWARALEVQVRSGLAICMEARDTLKGTSAVSVDAMAHLALLLLQATNQREQALRIEARGSEFKNLGTCNLTHVTIDTDIRMCSMMTSAASCLTMLVSLRGGLHDVSPDSEALSVVCRKAGPSKHRVAEQVQKKSGGASKALRPDRQVPPRRPFFGCGGPHRAASHSTGTHSSGIRGLPARPPRCPITLHSAPSTPAAASQRRSGDPEAQL